MEKPEATDIVASLRALHDHLTCLDSASPEAALMSEAALKIDRLRAVLDDAALQIQYLHEKFKPTGSGMAVLSRIRDAASGR